MARYVVRSGDLEFLRNSWPSLEKAYKFCVSAADTDGLLLNRTAGPAAADASALGGRVLKDIYLQGTWLAAMDGYAILAGLTRHNEAMEDARKRLDKARKSLDGWFREAAAATSVRRPARWRHLQRAIVVAGADAGLRRGGCT